MARRRVPDAESSLEERGAALSSELERLRAENGRLRAENGRLRRLTRTDPLTGVGNRRALRTRLAEAVAAARPLGSGGAVLFIDIDHFKAFNKRFGHLVGDQTLHGVARALKAGLRRTDFLARFGGEEFVALLPGTDLDGAVEVAERLRRAVAAGKWPGEGATVSIGVAAFGSERTTAPRLLRDADAAMRRAKAAGRNRVCH
jgi:diguanylate cyclase (GGDEF)-like protein